jgi:hypothetical protein
VSPWRLALTLVLQFVEGLSDRQVTDAVCGRLDWKYALAFELRQSRYIGLARTHLQHILTAAAMNIARFDAWVTGPFLARPYKFGKSGRLEIPAKQSRNMCRICRGEV